MGRTAVGPGDQGMVLEGWLWDTSTRVAFLVLALFILSNCGGDLIAWSCKESKKSGGRVNKEGAGGGGGERKQVLATITGHCLPKLVCQLHALESREHISDSFAAHMGQLVRGLEGTGCHNFYPDCPFSNQDVLQIARRINFK